MPRGVKGSGPAAKQAPAVAPAAPSPQASAQPPESSWKPLGSVDVDSLSGEDLKQYARRAGVCARDIDCLTEDRLRQNVKLAIANHFELLTE